jgi:tight adherence protein C
MEQQVAPKTRQKRRELAMAAQHRVAVGVAEGFVGRTLKVQADDMRIHRQLAAEEKAMKAPVKMLFPTVMFIFPAMFIVILGPAFLNIMTSLANAT